MNYDARGRKILVADSDRTVLELLQIRLDLAGFHTCIARTGPDALDVLKNVRPVCMVLDRALPEMDGFDVLRALCGRRDAPPFPVLFMGRNLAPDDVKLAASLGARDCLVKPFSGAQALERVARMLKQPSAAPRAVHYI